MSEENSFGSINDILEISNKYNDKLLIQKGELVYNPNKVSLQEKQWLKQLGINEASDFYTVEFNPLNGTKKDVQIIKSGDKAKIPSNPINGEFTFLGWYYLKSNRKLLPRIRI